jgi:hypothetical protein
VTVARAAGVDDILAHADADDCALLGASARLALDIDVAERAYVAVRTRFPGSAEAARAAFFLARIAADRRDDVASARLLRRYLAEAPAGDLLEEARGRLIEELAAAHDGGARAEAERYLASWPNGPHATLARTLAGGT